jgi:hypothetical protein
MTQSMFSLDHQLAEIRQVGDELRAARQADASRADRSLSVASVVEAIRHFVTGSRSTSRRSTGLAAS